MGIRLPPCELYYGKELDVCCQGMTAYITMDGMPLFEVTETTPTMIDFIKLHRSEREKTP